MEKIKELYLKNRPKLIIAFSVLLIIAAIINIYLVVAVRITSNDECLWLEKTISKDSTAIFFSNVKVGGVTWNAGIRDGDELLGIDNKSISNPTDAQIILNKFSYGQYADYTVKKNNTGQLLHTKVYVKKLIQVGAVANGMLALIWMLIGFIVLMSKTSGRVQKLFYAIGVAAVLSNALNFLPGMGLPVLIKGNQFPYAFVYIFLIWSLGVSYIPFLFLYFFWTFPTPYKFMEKKWIRILLLVLPLILSIGIFSWIFEVYRMSKIGVSRLQMYRNILDYVANGSQIVAFVSLAISYLKLKNREEKKPVLIILIAYLVAIVAVIYTSRIAPAISDTIFNSPEYYTPVILIILVPIAFAYSIFKYQLMDVSVVIKNTVMYGTATVGVAVIYFFIIYVLGQSISEAIGTQFQGLIAGIIFIAFAVVFQSTKDKFQDFLTAKFYPEQFAYQKVLVKFSNEVATVVGLDNILDSMKNTFVESLMVNRFGILLKNKKEDNFSLVRNVGINNHNLILQNDKLEEFIKQKSFVAEHIFIDRSEFVKAFPGSYVELEEQKIFTILPMIIKSKVIGLLLFGLKHSGAQFAGKDLELLYATASQAAIAVENARLYQTEAEKLRIERDLDLARKIQQGLLPKCVPNLGGLDICGEMIPAMQVGGDYFDYIQVTDSQLFIAVGDVSGKGLSASLYMTKLQTMIQLACVAGKTPKDVLVEINKRLYESMERNWFVTITLALFDMNNYTVQYCRAGHVPVLTAENGSVSSHRSKGLGVGLEKGVVFAGTLVEEKIKLKPGQIFGFFSDGITEAMNESLDMFGEDKLSEILKNKSMVKSTEIMDDIWKNLQAFRGNAEQNDDMTIVLVKVT